MLLWSRPSTPALTSNYGRFAGTRVVLLGVLALSAVACSKQAEGERCDILSGSDDCGDELTCTPLDTFNPGAEGAVCCSANPSVSVCRGGEFDYTEDGGTSTGEPTSSDAGASSSPATPSQSSSAPAPASDAGASSATASSAATGLSSGTISSASEPLSSDSAPTDSLSSVADAGASAAASSAATDAAPPDSGL